MTDSLGSGLSLDEQWDLYVDERSGDLSSTEEGDELMKDLAFILGRALTGSEIGTDVDEDDPNSTRRSAGIVGKVIDEGRAGDIRLRVRKLILSDPRVDTVEQVEVGTVNNGTELEIDITLITVTGIEIDDVITVS